MANTAHPLIDIPRHQVDEDLLEALKRRVRGRVLVLGVGNELRGDDAVGLAVVRALPPEVEALECGEVPESYLDEVRRRAPDCLLIVDAMDFGARPGSVGMLALGGNNPRNRLSLDTHRPSLELLAEYVRAEMGAETVVVGIQPRTVEWGAAMSPEVRQAGQALARWLSDGLGRGSNG